MPRSRRVFSEWMIVAMVSLGAFSGCEGCRREKEPERRSRQRAPVVQCQAAADCSDDNPCDVEECVSGQCVTTPLGKDQSCDNGNVCDGVARCDGKGACVPGAAPALDDRNACTTDSCDPVSGVRHEPLHIDDADVCTTDACDPRSGAITHVSIVIDDGNDCTLDTCDPASGPKHQQPSAFHSCSASCGDGFHAASRSPSPACGSRDALRTFCVPNCGDSFHSCEASCPVGYHAASRGINPQCSAGATLQPFCRKNGGGSFHTCDDRCPSGYEKRGETRGGQCGTSPSLMSFCAKG